MAPGRDTDHDPSPARFIGLRVAKVLPFEPAGQVSRSTDCAVGAQRRKPTLPPVKLTP